MNLKRFFTKNSVRYAASYFVAIVLFGVLYWAFSDQLKGEPSTLISSLYFSVVTITTLGYGDITPSSDWMKVIVIFQTVLGIILIGLFVNALIHEQSESEIRLKHNELLDNINRGLYRISRGSIDFRFYIPLPDDVEREYENLLLQKGVRQSSDIVAEKLTGVGVYSYQNNQQGLWRLHIPFRSGIFPQRVLADVIKEHFFCLEFYKSNRTLEELLAVEGNRSVPDLAVEIQTEIDGCRDVSIIGKHTFHYDVQSRGVEIEARNYNVDSEHWFQTGRMSSSLDLLGSQMVIRIQKKLVPYGSANDIYDQLKRSTILRWVTIDIRGFPRICLQGFRFSRHSDFNGYPVFIACLPKTIDEVRNLHPTETLEYQSKISGAKDGSLLGWFRLRGRP